MLLTLLAVLALFIDGMDGGFAFSTKEAMLDKVKGFRGYLPAQYAASGLCGCGWLSGSLAERLPFGSRD